MPVKIFSGIDHVVEKSVNSFARNVRVVDVRISTPSLSDPPRVAVLILYEGGDTQEAPAPGPEMGAGRADGAPGMPAGYDAGPAPVGVAAAVWVAAATLHRNEEIDELSVRQIRDKVVEQGICGKRSGKTIDSNITLLCVANAEPWASHRKLYRVRKGTYRLYRPGDDANDRRYGPDAPGPGELPDGYKHLPEWYAKVYCAARPP